MSDINIFVAENGIQIDAGESLGFFGPNGFGDPLSLDEFNGRTFITDPSGSAALEEGDNCRKVSASGLVIGQIGNEVNLQNLPNYLSTINIRFTHPVEVLVQDVRLIAFDGIDVNNAPSGLDVFGAEIIHTSRLQTDTGTGDTLWIQMTGSGQQLDLVDSPGTSGLSPLGPATLDIRHDWYIALSVAPILPGDRTFNFRVDLEFI